MSAKSSAAAAAPVPASPEQIRNVVLVGHSGSGKTTLYENLLAAGSDHRPGETERSVQLSVSSIDGGGCVVNLIDTPGYPDFVGELRAGLRAADAALFVLSAADDIDAATSALWRECAEVQMPRAVAVTKLDAGRGSFEETLTRCQEAFGEGVQPLYLPLMSGVSGTSTVAGNLGILSQQVYDYTGGTRVTREASEDEREQLRDRRDPLIEAIITESEDDTLLERYLGGEPVELEVVIADLLTAVARGSFHPVLPVSTQTGVGSGELMYLLREAFPPPTRHPAPLVTTPEGEPLPELTCDAGGPLVAEVVRTASDPYVGRTSVVRVFSGTLRPDQVVHVSGHLGRFSGHELEGHPEHDEDERIGLLSSPLGGTMRPKALAIAGDIAVVARLSRADTSDTLSEKDHPVLIEPWVLPDSLLPVAIHAVSSAEDDKLAGALARLVAEDPTMRLERNAETHQLVLWTMGQAHIDLSLERLRERYGVDVETEPLRVPLRETFVGPAKGHGRNVKQSGGHGQYAVCDITIEPNERGAGFEFVDKVFGGAVPRQFIPSVEKGVRAQLDKGVVAGYPMVDVRVTLTDGKAHSVDSSDMAFQTAGSLALKDAAGGGSVTLLEPYDRLQIVVADEYVGAVMTDLSTRRGRVLSSLPGQDGKTTIAAEVPQVELTRYAIDLRSVAHGTGSFSRELLGYEPMPAHLVKEHLATS